MIPENIKALLDSDNEADNEVGWELVDAQGVSFKDVKNYVENAKVPTGWVHKYKWDGKKYIRNDNPAKKSSTYYRDLVQQQQLLDQNELHKQIINKSVR